MDITNYIKDQVKLTNAVYCKKEGIELSEEAEQRLNEATEREKGEIEIQMIESEYLLNELKERSFKDEKR